MLSNITLVTSVICQSMRQPISAGMFSSQPHFKTDAAGKPTCVAGRPPDEFFQKPASFSNPIYDWEAAACGYAWWIERLVKASRFTTLSVSALSSLGST